MSPSPGTNRDAGSRQLSMNLSGVERSRASDINNNKDDSEQSQYLPSGPHGRVRMSLMRAQAVLAGDLSRSWSKVSLQSLEKAVSAFLAEAYLLTGISTSPAGPRGSRGGQVSQRPGKTKGKLSASERIARRQKRDWEEQKRLHNV